MIIDQLSNAKQYYGIHPRLEKGFKYLMETDLNSLEPGTYEIEGSNIFAMIQQYESVPFEKGRWESHYKYTDIQYIISGEEKMGYANIGQMKIVEQYADRDLLFLEGNGDLVKVKEGAFCVFTPEDVHMPKLMSEKPQEIKKVVVKVLID